MSTVIKVENVSKLYRLGEVGTGTLSHDLNRWYHRLRGKEDPYLKIGESNDRANKGSSEYVYALKDINFEVKEGEVLGIIGKNGAGKSTLLKLLSRVTGPSSGSIKIKGRTASLLEVGTGFHPELTGRENIFLNGAILGMTKSEIRRKFDEIVDFSGVERYIDTPVKRYSSGMYVRLAFAVAAHLDPEILIVDEVLAVGDAEFQKRCLGKMGDISKNEGRTILFVSHNMAAVENLCISSILLEKGSINGEKEKTSVILDTYFQRSHFDNKLDVKKRIDRQGTQQIKLSEFRLTQNGRLISTIKLEDKFNFELLLVNKFKMSGSENIRVVIGMYNLKEEAITRFDSDISGYTFKIGSENFIKLKCSIIDSINLTPGLYFFNVAIFNGITMLDYVQNVTQLEIVNSDFYRSGKSFDQNLTRVFFHNTWEVL